MCGVTLKDRCKSEELRKHLDIEDVANVIKKSRLGWFCHLEIKERDARDWVSACKNMAIVGNAGNFQYAVNSSAYRKRGGGMFWRTT